MSETFFQYIVIAIFIILGAGLGYKLRQKRKAKYINKNNENQ